MYNPPHKTPNIKLTYFQRLYYYWCWKDTMTPKYSHIYGLFGRVERRYFYNFDDFDDFKI